jgi:MtN3 and saliva related transmembrane protein
MHYAEIVGFGAGSFVAASLLPQVVKSWKTKSTQDIAIGWTIMSLGGQVLWETYGWLIHSPSLIVMSGLTLVMAFSVLYLKIKYG